MKIDPLKRTCSCGYYWYFSKWDYVKMILLGSLTYSCPQCHLKHKYILIYHAVEESNEFKLENKQLAEGKFEIWRKG